VLEERDAVLELGDVMLLYSDGLTDATNAMGEYFGEQRLQAVFIEHARETVENLIRAVLDAIDVFTGGEAQYDDITLVAVRRQPIAPQEAIPADWTRANFPAQRMPAYVRRRAV